MSEPVTRTVLVNVEWQDIPEGGPRQGMWGRMPSDWEEQEETAVPWCAEHDASLHPPELRICFEWYEGFHPSDNACRLEDPPQHWREG